MEQRDGKSSFCEDAARFQVGLKEEDNARLKLTDTFQASQRALEDCHTQYEFIGDVVNATTCSHTDHYLDIHNTGEMACSKQISCKMISSARAEQQLKTIAEHPNRTCRDINLETVRIVEGMAAKPTHDRFKQKGRGWCFQEDKPTWKNVGPLWLVGNMELTETAECMSVTSLALHTEVDGKIYPGNSYCKLLSPTRILDWMMTDSLKPFVDVSSVMV